MKQRRHIVLSHHWLLRYRGGEQVLEQLCHVFRDAPIAALFYKPNELPDVFHGRKVYTSILARIPFSDRIYNHLLPLFPLALRLFCLPKDIDLVVCSDAALMKGMRIPQKCQLICYCHSPPRYLWDLNEVYAKSMKGPVRIAFRMLRKWIRRKDQEYARRVDHFIANSSFVAQRIKDFYGREAKIICPPAKLHEFNGPGRNGDYFLMVGELVPYKRADLVVRAFRDQPWKLKVIGGGPGLARIKREAGPNTEILGYLPRAEVVEHLLNCKAYIQPQLEDFGITAVEAQAAGKAVIGFGQGGLLDIVQDGETAVFFSEQTEDSIRNAIEAFEELCRSDGHFTEALAFKCKKNAQRFSVERFRASIMAFVDEKAATPLHSCEEKSSG